MADTGSSGRPPHGPGILAVHAADELEVYFNEMARGRPIGFVASPKWKPPTDVYETEDAIIVRMDIAGMRSEAFQVQLADGVLTIQGERAAEGVEKIGKRHYHIMEVQIGPFERRLRIPVPVEPETVRASYDAGFLEVRLRKLPPRPSGPQSVKVG